MNALEKEIFATNVRVLASGLEALLDSKPMKELRAEHSEIRLPRSLRNHLMDLQCDLSQFVPPSTPNT